MSTFSEVDAVIGDWVRATSSTLFTEWAGKPARFFHIPGAPPFECFQVSIDLPSADRVSVLACSIDTNDESELEQGWEGLVSELDALLAEAIATIEIWKERPQAARG